MKEFHVGIVCSFNNLFINLIGFKKIYSFFPNRFGFAHRNPHIGINKIASGNSGFQIVGYSYWSAGFFCNFDFKVVSSKVGFRKPNQKIYRKIFNIGNWEPNQIVYIDDHKLNIESVKKLGIHGIKFVSYKKLASQLDILIFQKD